MVAYDYELGRERLLRLVARIQEQQRKGHPWLVVELYEIDNIIARILELRHGCTVNVGTTITDSKGTRDAVSIYWF